jgi:hypothetical protein
VLDSLRFAVMPAKVLGCPELTAAAKMPAKCLKGRAVTKGADRGPFFRRVEQGAVPCAFMAPGFWT